MNKNFHWRYNSFLILSTDDLPIDRDTAIPPFFIKDITPYRERDSEALNAWLLNWTD